MQLLKDIKAVILQGFRSSKSDYQRALSEFSRTLTLIVDFDQLVDSLIGKLREIAHIPNIIILLRDLETNLFTVADYRGTEHSKNIEKLHFQPEGTLVSWLTTNEIPLITSESPGVIMYLSQVEQNILENLRRKHHYFTIQRTRK